jgi:hypothetical protein
MSVGTFVDATLQAVGRSLVPALGIDRRGRIIRCQSGYLLRVPDAVEVVFRLADSMRRQMIEATCLKFLLWRY